MIMDYIDITGDKDEESHELLNNTGYKSPENMYRSPPPPPSQPAPTSSFQPYFTASPKQWPAQQQNYPIHATHQHNGESFNNQAHQVNQYNQQQDYYPNITHSNPQQQQPQRNYFQVNQLQNNYNNFNQTNNGRPDNNNNGSRYIPQISPGDFYGIAGNNDQNFDNQPLSRSFFENVPKDTPLISPPVVKHHRVVRTQPINPDNVVNYYSPQVVSSNGKTQDIDNNINGNGIEFHSYVPVDVQPYDAIGIDNNNSRNEFIINGSIDSTIQHSQNNYTDNKYTSENTGSNTQTNENGEDVMIISDGPYADRLPVPVEVGTPTEVAPIQLGTIVGYAPPDETLVINSPKQNLEPTNNSLNNTTNNDDTHITDGSHVTSSSLSNINNPIGRIDNTFRANYDPNVRFPIHTLPSNDWPHIPPQQLGTFIKGLGAKKTIVPSDNQFRLDLHLYSYDVDGIEVSWDYNTGFVNATALFAATKTPFDKLLSIITKHPQVNRVTEYDLRTQSYWIPMAVAVPFVTYMKKYVFALTPIFGRSILEGFDDIKTSLNGAPAPPLAPEAPTGAIKVKHMINTITGPAVPQLSTAELIPAKLTDKLDKIFGKDFDTSRNHSAELGILLFDELRGNAYNNVEIPIFIESLLKYFPESSWGLEPDYRILAIQKITELSSSSVWTLTSQKGKAFIRLYSWLKHDYKKTNTKALVEILKIVKLAQLSKPLLEHFHLLKIVKILNAKLDHIEVKKLTAEILDFKTDAANNDENDSDSGSGSSSSTKTKSKPSLNTDLPAKAKPINGSASRPIAISASSGTAGDSIHIKPKPTHVASTTTNGGKNTAPVSLAKPPASLNGKSTAETSGSKNTLGTSRKPISVSIASSTAKISNLSGVKRPLSLSSSASNSSSAAPAAKKANIYVASAKKTGASDSDKKTAVSSIDTSKANATSGGDKRVWSFSDYVKKGSAVTESAANGGESGGGSSGVTAQAPAKKFSLDNYKKTNDIDTPKSAYEIPTDGGILRRRFQSSNMAKRIDNYEVREPKLIEINGEKVKKFVRWHTSVDQDEERKAFRGFDDSYSPKNAHRAEIGEGKALAHFTPNFQREQEQQQQAQPQYLDNDEDEDANYEPSL